MKPIILVLPTVLSVLSLGAVYVQQRRIVDLEARLAAATPATAEEAEARPDLSDLPLLRARLDRLERTLAAQAASPAAPAPPATPTSPAAPPPPAIEQLRADVDALLTGEATRTEQGKARLKNLLDEAQREQSREREQRRDERVLDRLAQAARMSDRQREDIGKAMEVERASRRALIESGRSGLADFEQLRPQIEALRAETDRKAKAILDSEQYTAYEESRARAAGPRGGGGPGGARSLGAGGSVSPAAIAR